MTVNKSKKNNLSIKEDNLYGEAWKENEKQLKNIIKMAKRHTVW